MQTNKTKNRQEQNSKTCLYDVVPNKTKNRQLCSSCVVHSKLYSNTAKSELVMRNIVYNFVRDCRLLISFVRAVFEVCICKPMPLTLNSLHIQMGPTIMSLHHASCDSALIKPLFEKQGLPCYSLCGPVFF